MYLYKTTLLQPYQRKQVIAVLAYACHVYEIQDSRQQASYESILQCLHIKAQRQSKLKLCLFACTAYRMLPCLTSLSVCCRLLE